MDKPRITEEMKPMEEMNESEITQTSNLIQPIRIYQGLEEAVEGLPASARKVMNFLQQRYPEQIIVMLNKGTLREFLKQRTDEAANMFEKEHRKMQDQANVWGMDTMSRIQTEEQIGTTLREMIESEILYRPLTF